MITLIHEHKLKTLPEYFEPVGRGDKTFEIRKDDRAFKVGDTLILQEWKSPPSSMLSIGDYTGREIHVRVTYKMSGGKFGLPEHMCIMGFKIFKIIDQVGT